MKRQKMTDEAAEAVGGLAENTTTCTICADQMYKDVVQAAGCGHLFHGACVKPLTDCPNCRAKNCKFFVDVNICKWWAHLLVKCKNEGCEVKVYPWDEDHAKECSFMPCPFCGLEVFGKLSGMFSHMTKICKVSANKETSMQSGGFENGMLVIVDKAEKSDTKIEVRLVTEDESMTGKLVNLEWNEDGRAYSVKTYPSLSIYDITSINMLAPFKTIPAIRVTRDSSHEMLTLRQLKPLFLSVKDAHLVNRDLAATCRVNIHSHVTLITYSTLSGKFEVFDNAGSVGTRISWILKISMLRDPSLGTEEVLSFIERDVDLAYDVTKHVPMLRLIFPKLILQFDNVQ